MSFAYGVLAEGHWQLATENHHGQTYKVFAAYFFSVVENVPTFLGNKSVFKCTSDLVVSTITGPFALTLY